MQTPSPMTDITTRLRRWTHDVDAAPASDLMDEAARDIEMLRMALARIADQDATFSVIGGNIIVDVEPTLADAEREALVSVLNRLCGEMTQDERQTLIGLLERMGKPTESE